MAKIMLTIGDQTLKRLDEIAHCKDITTQELIRAVIIPEWFIIQTTEKSNHR